jgi:hypothetical protein
VLWVEGHPASILQLLCQAQRLLNCQPLDMGLPSAYYAFAYCVLDQGSHRANSVAVSDRSKRTDTQAQTENQRHGA